MKILCFKKLQFRVHSFFSVVVCRLVWVELRYRLLRFFFGGLTTNLSFHVIVLKSETKAVGWFTPKKIITDRFQQPICLGSEFFVKKDVGGVVLTKSFPSFRDPPPNNCTVGRTWRTSDLS